MGRVIVEFSKEVSMHGLAGGCWSFLVEAVADLMVPGIWRCLIYGIGDDIIEQLLCCVEKSCIPARDHGPGACLEWSIELELSNMYRLQRIVLQCYSLCSEHFFYL
jgi:hypothetical protein